MLFVFPDALKILSIGPKNAEQNASNESKSKTYLDEKNFSIKKTLLIQLEIKKLLKMECLRK